MRREEKAGAFLATSLFRLLCVGGDEIKVYTRSTIEPYFNARFQIENLEELLKEKDNQVEMARSKLSTVQAQTFTSEGALTSLEEALGDRDKQINQLREQRDRAEKDLKEEKDLHDREITDYKMKIHTLESEVEKLQVRLDKALTEKDKLEAKLEYSQAELGKSKAEVDKYHVDTGSRYGDYTDWRQKLTKADIEIDRLRQENDRLHMELDRMRDMPPPPAYGLRDRSRSPEPGYASRSVHVEVAELKDKLEQTQTELRRTQAELRLNTGDYERSHVELEQMQEKVELRNSLLTNSETNFGHDSSSSRLKSPKVRFTGYERNWKAHKRKTKIWPTNLKRCKELSISLMLIGIGSLRIWTKYAMIWKDLR